MATIHKEKHWRRTIVTVAIALCAGVSQLAVAQEAKGLNVDVGNCVRSRSPRSDWRASRLRSRQRGNARRQRPRAKPREPARVPSRERARLPAPWRRRTCSIQQLVRPNLSDWALPPPALARRRPANRAPPKTSASRSAVPSGRPSEHRSKSSRQSTELRQTVPNAYVITLDNGQVWRQAHPMPYPLRTGLVVRLRETTFGYRLSAPELHGQINVERVR